MRLEIATGEVDRARSGDGSAEPKFEALRAGPIRHCMRVGCGARSPGAIRERVESRTAQGDAEASRDATGGSSIKNPRTKPNFDTSSGADERYGQIKATDVILAR